MDNFLILHKERIITNADLARRNKLFADWFDSIGIGPSKISLNLTSGKLLIIDPIYLADIYNKNDTKEKYLKSAGVLLTDYCISV